MRDSVKIRVVRPVSRRGGIDLHGTDVAKTRLSSITVHKAAWGQFEASERLLGDVFCKARNTLPMNANPKPEPILRRPYARNLHPQSWASHGVIWNRRVSRALNKCVRLAPTRPTSLCSLSG